MGISGERPLPALIGGRYQLGSHIRSGAYGEVYYGLDIHTKELVAVKLEHFTAELPQLHYEAKVYKTIGGAQGVPRMRWHGKAAGYTVLVIDLLGHSLKELFDYSKDHSTDELRHQLILTVGLKTIDLLEYLHNKKFVHRDLKLENLLCALDITQPFDVSLIDFGLAKKYCCSSTGSHIPYRNDKTTFTGNQLFGSINSHVGVESSRRDDMESLAYIMIYLCRGSLPWQHDGLKTCVQKITTPIKVLCEACPAEFATFLEYCRRLEFAERPDYDYLRRLLRRAQEDGPSYTQDKFSLAETALHSPVMEQAIQSSM